MAAFGPTPRGRGGAIAKRRIRVKKNASCWLPRSSQRLAIEPSGTNRRRICRDFTACDVGPRDIACALDSAYVGDMAEASVDARRHAEWHSWRRWRRRTGGYSKKLREGIHSAFPPVSGCRQQAPSIEFPSYEVAGWRRRLRVKE
jgi:hypothetical protein